MNKYILHLTIGIPAYNEAKNIGHLLMDLSRQAQRGFVLKEIILVSDGSTDETVKVAKSSGNPLLKIVAHKNRLGLADTQNEIFKRASGSICVILHADTVIPRTDMLTELVRAMARSQADLVSGNLIPLPGKTFFSRILRIGSLWKHEAYASTNGGINLYTCYGPVRAFSKNLYKQLRFIHSVGEDMYSYLYTISHGYKYSFAKKAIVEYKLPQTFRDHAKQSLRFFRSTDWMDAYVSHQVIESESRFPISSLFKLGLKLFVANPVGFTCYLIISVYLSLLAKLSPQHGQINTWEIATSSKGARD